MVKNHRVVFVAGGIKLGGATTFLLNLGGELIRRGVPVLVVGLEHENPYRDDFKKRGIPVHIEDERIKVFEDRLSSAFRVIRDFNPFAVVSCLGPSSYEILRYVPESVMRLGMLQSDYPGSYPVLAVYAPYFDGTVGVSRVIESNLRAHQVLGRLPAYYLPYGVKTTDIPPRESRPPGRPLRVLYFGRLIRSQKRVHLFPEILRQLEAAKIVMEWTIAGDGPELRWLESKMLSSSTVTVRFCGALEYAGVSDLLQSHDAFLLASDEEGLPLSLLEAMAHGLVPVVSNLSSGVSEVVDEESGILVDPQKIDGYAAGLLRLARDQSLFSSLSDHARERVRTNYSISAMTDRWLSVIAPSEKSAAWPESPRIRGPLVDQRRWPYTTMGRFLRRAWKRSGIAAMLGGSVASTKPAQLEH